MKKFFLYPTTLTIILFLNNCTKDFIVTDIKNKVVTINAPADNLTTANNAITFWWEELDGAETYNLQIVKPNFNSVQQLLVDTNVTGNKFNYTFSPGTYQWRIKATNAGGSTVYSTRSLIIDTTSNLSQVTVASSFPITNYLTGNRQVTFSWNAIDAATYYELEVKNQSNLIVINPNNILGTSYTYSFSNTTDANYTWRVKAYNSFSFSQYNTARTFTIDVTAPIASNLVFPSHGATNISAVNDSLKWNRTLANALLDTKYDSLIISTDSNFISPPYITRAKVYGTKFKIASLSPVLTSPSPSGNNYYWLKIISVDSVKNTSAPSPKYKFKLM